MNKKQAVLCALPALLGALAAAFPGAVSASNFLLTEQSAASLGRAHAGGASDVDNDSSAIWYNPAGLTELKGSEVLGGYALIRFGAAFTKTTAVDATGQPLSGGNGGSVGKLGGPLFAYYAKPLNDNWVVGIGLNTPFGLATSYDGDSIFRYQADYTSVSIINLGPTAAYKINDQWSIGFGIDYQQMQVKLTNAVDFGAVCFGTVNPVTCNGIGLTPQSHDGFFSAQASGNGTGYNLGALWKIDANDRLGFSYRSRISHSLSGNASFENVPTLFATQAQFQGQSISSNFDSPQIMSLSYLRVINDQWTLTADWTYTGWSSFSNLDIKFANPGTRDAVVQEGLSNVNRYSVGLDYKYNEDWTFRSGVALDISPVPNPTAASDTTPNSVNASRTARLPDGDRKWLAFGATWHTTDHSQWDLGYAHLFISSSIPFDQVDGTSADHIVGTYKADADIVGLSYRYRF